jgi:acetyl esterase
MAMLKALKWLVIACLAVAGLVYAAFQLSPWPSVLLIRHWFGNETRAISDALAKHVPRGIAAVIDEPYDPQDPAARLDVFRPENAVGPLPVVVWAHGGAFVFGSKSDVTNYLKIVAARGYVMVAVGYSIAPSATYPTPVMQVNRALGYVQANAERLGIDPRQIFLAGDSAGAQIAAQVSLLVTAPDYAARVGIAPRLTRENLRSVILFCGALDTQRLNFKGPFGGFLTTVLWAYTGTRDFINDPRLMDFSIPANMTKDFPPFFISVGNADPLAPSSRDMELRARQLGVPVDALFFSKNHQPPLPHEYQFNLDGEDGQLALNRMLAFLAARRLE